MVVYCLLTGNQSQSEKVICVPCLCGSGCLKSNLLRTIHLPLCFLGSDKPHSCSLAFLSLLDRETRADPPSLNSWIILLLHFPTWRVWVMQFWWPSDFLVPGKEVGLSHMLSAKSAVGRSSALLEGSPLCLCGLSRCIRRCWGLTGECNVRLPRLN